MGNPQKLGNFVNALFQDASNNVGIGAAPSGSYKLEVTGTAKVSSTLLVSGAATFSSSVTADYLTANSGALINTTSAPFILYNSGGGGNAKRFALNMTNGDYMKIYSLNDNGTTRTDNILTATIGGNVGIGTSSPSDKLNVVVSANGNNTRFDGPTSGLIFQTNATSTDIISYGGTTPAYRQMNFATGASTAMSITSGGNVMVGNTTDRNYRFQANSDTSGVFAMEVRQNSGVAANCPLSITHEFSSGTRTMVRFLVGGFGEVGSITSTNTTTNFNTSSDYRLKEDLQEINGLEKAIAIKVYNFKWKNEEGRSDGVLAHELAEILPYAVYGEKDGIDENGNDKMQGVDYSKLVPIMLKAIQEQNQIIQELNERLNKAGL